MKAYQKKEKARILAAIAKDKEEEKKKKEEEKKKKEEMKKKEEKKKEQEEKKEEERKKVEAAAQLSQLGKKGKGGQQTPGGPPGHDCGAQKCEVNEEDGVCLVVADWSTDTSTSPASKQFVDNFYRQCAEESTSKSKVRYYS